MGGRRISNSEEAIPVRSRTLIPAAAACGLLWVGAVVVAGLQLDSTTLQLVLGAAGVLATAGLLLLIQRQHSRLRSLARTDALTGLANHRSFHESLAAELDDARERSDPLALVLLDLDNFKPVNEAHGHPYGDEILRAVGVALRDTVSSADQPARIGGAEFGLILPGRDKDSGFEVAERARAAVAAIPVHGFQLSCSAGVAAFPGDAEDPVGPDPARDQRPAVGQARRQAPHPPLRPRPRSGDLDRSPAGRDRGAPCPRPADHPRLPARREPRQRADHRL